MFFRMPLYFLIMLIIMATVSAEWLEFNAGCNDGASPFVRHNTTEDQFISFDVELRGLLADSTEYDSDYYWRFIRSPGTRTADSVGYPEVPVVTCFVIVPDDTDLDLVYAANCPETIEGLTVYPAPLDSVVYNSGVYVEEFFRKDSAAYASEDWYPAELAELSGQFMLRDQRIAIVDVYPVQYMASEDSLRVWSDIEIMIEFEELDPDWSSTDLGPYEKIIGDRLIGYRASYSYASIPDGSVTRITDLGSPPSIVPDYVIIIGYSLDCDEVDDLAWHRADLNGFDVAIIRTDDIYDYYSTPSEPYLNADMIRDFTEDMWNWGSPGNRSSYLLLIGDHEDVGCTTWGPWFLPTYIKTVGWVEKGNDEWFVYFDENRATDCSFPDMMVGRLPVRDTDELIDMIDLILDFEEEVTIYPQPSGYGQRRHLTRLSGWDPGCSYDNWHPSEAWTSDLADWCDYSLSNYYCGDGDDTSGDDPPNPDGSSMTSGDWVGACEGEFRSGSLINFYSDHGGVHYYDCAMNSELGNYAGRPDSTYDDLDVRYLTAVDPRWSPFTILFSCSQGTYNWTHDLHYNSDYSLWNCYSADPQHTYDFGVDCFAEELMKNTSCGAIGVFASSWACYGGHFDLSGYQMLEQMLYMGATRLGDGVAAGRINSLDVFWTSGDQFHNDLGFTNLLGDPAVDIGDRVIFRNKCDLILSPLDLGVNAFPTRPVSGSSTVYLYATVRNTGAVSSGSFSVKLEVSDPLHFPPDVLYSQCSGLDPGEEETLSFEWTHNSWFTPPGPLTLSGTADYLNQRQESWEYNNSATIEVDVLDFYPNDDGWPVQLIGSIKTPPILANLDEDDDLEIVVVVGTRFLQAFDPDSPDDPIWTAGPFVIQPGYTQGSSAPNGISIPAASDVTGDGNIEIVIDTKDELFVLDGSNGSTICSYQHSELGSEWVHYTHAVTLADVFLGPRPYKDEIIFLVGDMLYILGVTSSSTIQVLDSFDVCQGKNSHFSWVAAADLDGSGGVELIVSISHFDGIGSEDWTRIGLYNSSSTGEFYATKDWNEEDTFFFRGIPAIGTLPTAGQSIALSRRLSISGSFDPAIIIDPDNMTSPQGCTAPATSSNQVLCCLMADWVTGTGVDRVLAVAENQCFAWDEDGDPASQDWPAEYESSAVTSRPPFPALGNLDNLDQEDLISGTRSGVVFAFDNDAEALSDLGFPYTLPSEIYGGFTIADIDRDGYVEVVFGTMDNYLHVWELDECSTGYAPWTQCQHDAARTGALIE